MRLRSGLDRGHSRPSAYWRMPPWVARRRTPARASPRTSRRRRRRGRRGASTSSEPWPSRHATRQFAGRPSPRRQEECQPHDTTPAVSRRDPPHPRFAHTFPAVEEQRTRHPWLERLREQRDRHLSRSKFYRVPFAFLGFTVVLLGLAM